MVAGLGKDRALAPPLVRFSPPVPPHPRLCGGGGGEASALREAVRARARGVHTRVRALLCRRVFVYPCVCSWVCSYNPIGTDPSVCLLHACGGNRVVCVCVHSRVHMCTGILDRVGDVYTPAWVEGAVRTGRFARLYMRVSVQAGVCVCPVRRLFDPHMCTRLYGCVPCCVHVSVCTLRPYHVMQLPQIELCQPGGLGEEGLQTCIPSWTTHVCTIVHVHWLSVLRNK